MREADGESAGPGSLLQAELQSAAVEEEGVHAALQPGSTPRAAQQEHVRLLLQQEQPLPADVEEHMREAQVPKHVSVASDSNDCSRSGLAAEAESGHPSMGLVAVALQAKNAAARAAREARHALARSRLLPGGGSVRGSHDAGQHDARQRHDAGQHGGRSPRLASSQHVLWLSKLELARSHMPTATITTVSNGPLGWH